MQKDFYEVLGVSRDADADAIKKAYRQIAMKYHPDRNPGNKEAEEKFKEAASAYEVLSNTEKKAKYDRFGHAAFQGGAGGSGFGAGGFQDVNDIFASFGDIFGDLFGQREPRGARSQRPQRGSDLRYFLEVTLDQVVTGAEEDVEFESEESCVTCSGSGAEPGSRPETCTTCRGAGQVVRAQGFFSVATTCSACGGAGEIIRNKCKKCRGQGRVAQQRKIRVKVPPGVRSGTRLRVAGEGEGGYRGGPSGDLYVEVRVLEDSRFERRGDDLVGRVSVPYLMAILGGAVEVPVIGGRETVEVPAGTQPGQSLKLAGKGIPSLKGYGRGDLYFVTQVEIPQKLDSEEEKALRELAERKGLKVKETKSGLFRRK